MDYEEGSWFFRERLDEARPKSQEELRNYQEPPKIEPIKQERIILLAVWEVHN